MDKELYKFFAFNKVPSPSVVTGIALYKINLVSQWSAWSMKSVIDPCYALGTTVDVLSLILLADLLGTEQRLLIISPNKNGIKGMKNFKNDGIKRIC